MTGLSTTLFTIISTKKVLTASVEKHSESKFQLNNLTVCSGGLALEPDLLFL